MPYAERVIIIRKQESEGYLGRETVEVRSNPIPCYRGPFTKNEQMGLFGAYDFNAFKLYLQGIHEDFNTVEYKGHKQAIKGKIYHKNSTVIYL